MPKSIGMIRQCSRYYKSKYKKKETVGSRIQNMLGSTDREEGSTNRDANFADFNFGLTTH